MVSFGTICSRGLVSWSRGLVVSRSCPCNFQMSEHANDRSDVQAYKRTSVQSYMSILSTPKSTMAPRHYSTAAPRHYSTAALQHRGTMHHGYFISQLTRTAFNRQIYFAHNSRFIFQMSIRRVNWNFLYLLINRNFALWDHSLKPAWKRKKVTGRPLK